MGKGENRQCRHPGNGERPLGPPLAGMSPSVTAAFFFPGRG